jgi:hypothetical protein
MRHKKWILVLPITFAFALISSAAPVKPAARTYDETRKLVCEGNNRDEYCDRIDNEVNREAADILTSMRPVVHSAAKVYGVDPVTIVGSILAEHSMNTGLKDIGQNALVNLGIAKNGTLDFGFFKKTFTFGFGQLNFERALEAEAIAAAVEKRPLRTNDQVKEALMTPEGAVYYAAALVRQAQDLYLAAGYDLSEDPAVLTTLYNIGKINERLERTKKEGRLPQPNYFGAYVLKNKDRFNEIVGDYNPNADISLAKSKGNAPADSPYEIRYTAKETLRPLKSGMTNVGISNAAFSTSLELKPGDQFDLKGSIEDPTLGTLHLVQAVDGKMGYLPEALIAKKSQQVLVQKKTCAVNGDKKCLEDMEDYLSETDGETFAHMNPVPQKAKPVKKMSPREKIMFDAKNRAEDLLNKFSKQVITWSDDEAKTAKSSVQKIFDGIDPMLGDYAKSVEKRVAELNNKKKALESLPKLEENDMVEILGAIRDFREKSAKLQPSRMGAITSPYVVFEPLMEFYELCAIQHHGDSEQVAQYFDDRMMKKNLSFEGTYNPGREDGDILQNMKSGNATSAALYFYRRQEREGYAGDASFAPSKKKGREGQMERVVDGENCYGDKKQFLDWIKSVPVKANPSWADLEKPYEQVRGFYLPIARQSDIKQKVDNIPQEIAQIQQNSKQIMESIEKTYPKIRERLTSTLKMLDAKSKKESAQRHPLMIAAEALREQITACKLAVVKNPDLLKKIDGIESQLSAEMNSLMINYSQGNKQTMVIDYNSYDTLANLLYSIYPNGIPQEVKKLIKSTVPVRMGLPDYGSEYAQRWDFLGKMLAGSCGVFEQDPLLQAALENPSLLPAGAEACEVEIYDPASLRNYGTVKNIKMKLLDAKQQFQDEKSRYALVEDNLKQYGRYFGNYTDGQTASTAARFPDYHSLAKELSEKDCVQAIFVSRVQELDLPKTVLLPSGDTNSIRVVWKGTKCN